MKIFVIHGEHTLDSYNRLQEYVKKAKDNNWEVQYIEKADNIHDALLGQSLFSEKRLLILKDITLLNSSLIKWIKNNESRIESNLIIYHKGLLGQRIIKSLPKVDKVEDFKITKLIWNFLDSLFPGNLKNAYKLFHEVIKTEAVEFVFAMMARQFRDIYWAKVDPKSMDYPAWRVGKYKNLASKFSRETLETLLEEMSRADINSKTSNTSLENSLDFIMVKYLE